MSTMTLMDYPENETDSQLVFILSLKRIIIYLKNTYFRDKHKKSQVLLKMKPKFTPYNVSHISAETRSPPE